MKIDLTHIPAQPAAKLETDVLKDTIAHLRKVRDAAGRKSDLGRRIKRTVVAVLRRLIRMEDFNLRVVLKCEMLGNKNWRQRVIEDLGGEAALSRWEKRKAKAKEIVLDPRIVPYVDTGDDPWTVNTAAPQQIQDTRETITIPGTEATEYKVRYIKTDRDGLFCLAPIKHAVRLDTIPEQFARHEARTWRQAMTFTPKTPKPKRPETFQPIPVTPGELWCETFPPPEVGGKTLGTQSSSCSWTASGERGKRGYSIRTSHVTQYSKDHDP